MSSRQDLDPLIESEQLELKLQRKIREAEILNEITTKIQASSDLADSLNSFLDLLDNYFSFRYSMILTVNEPGQDLKVVATHGYKDAGIGSKVKIGEGIIGTVAKKKKPLRMPAIQMQVAYMMAAKQEKDDPDEEVVIKLPGLQHPRSQIAIPLLKQDHLMGVLTVERTS